MNLRLSGVTSPSETRRLLADGGRHFFGNDGPILMPVKCPTKVPRTYAPRKKYKSTGIFAKFHAMEIGDEPVEIPKRCQSHAGSFSDRFGVKLKTRTMPCGELVEVWRVA